MTKPFKLTAPRILESDRQSQIIDWLRAEQAAGRVSWFCRVNGGLARYGRFMVKNYILHLAGLPPASKGYPDIHGMLPGGRYFTMEVKQPGEKATPEQSAFMAVITAAGGIAAVVYGFEDVERVLRRDSSDGRAGFQVAGSSPAPGSNQSRVSGTTEGAPLQRNDAAPGANFDRTPAGGALTPAESNGSMLQSKTPPQVLPDLPTRRATKNPPRRDSAPVTAG